MRSLPAAALALVLAALPSSADESRWRTVTIGLCEDYPEESTTLDRVREDLDLLAATGVRHLRVSIGWDSVEPEDDRFEWAFWDAFVALATERGIVLAPYLCYTPGWAARDEDAGAASPPSDPAEFAEFAAAVATRYGDRVGAWEIWNEPDNPAFWDGTAAEYAVLLEAGSRAVRAADPGALVVAGGLAWDLEFLETLLEAHDAAAWIDVVNLHAYFETWSPEPLEATTAYLERAAELVGEHGDGEAIWTAEVGYSSYRRGSRVSDPYEAAYAYEHTEAYQAVALVRTLAMILATGEASHVAWYEVRDLPPDEAVIGDANNRHLGIATAAGRPKPARAALEAFARLFAVPHRTAGDLVRVERAVDSTAEVRAFELEDGRLVAIAWLRTAWPGRPPAPDARRESIDLAFPRGDRASVLDELGRERAARTLASGRLEALELRGGEVRIVVVR